MTWFWKSVRTDGSETAQAGGWPEEWTGQSWFILSGCGLKNKYGSGGRSGILDLLHSGGDSSPSARFSAPSLRHEWIFPAKPAKTAACRPQRPQRL
jgi:hypothetical protein